MAGPSDHAEFHVWESEPSPVDIDRALSLWRPYLGRAILDIGCGEGHLLAGLGRAGLKAEGVDLTPELVARATARGLEVTQSDAVEFIACEGHRFDTFMMMDFVEHIPFAKLEQILAAAPKGARCIIQTPNTNSVIGHQFYLQVPSHVTPLSPHVLGKMLARAGFDVETTGTSWGGLPWTGLRRRLTLFVLTKIFGVTMLPLFVEGANFYIVATKKA